MTFCSTVSSSRLIMQLHSAGPVSSRCVGWARLHSLCMQRWQRNLYTLLSAADWTTATACLLVLIFGRDRKCRQWWSHEGWVMTPVRITFKTTVTVDKTVSTAWWQSTARRHHAGGSHLRSVNTHQIIIPRTRTSYGDRRFSVHGSVVWNDLPRHPRWTDVSLASFRDRLRTFLFDDDK